MVAWFFVFLLFPHKCFSQNQYPWFQLEPDLQKSQMSMFSAIYNNTLFLIGGLYTSVTHISLNRMIIKEYDGVIYQPDVNIDSSWITTPYYYGFGFKLYCTDECSSNIDNLLYIIAPFQMIGNQEAKQSNTLYIYNLEIKRFESTLTYQSLIPNQYLFDEFGLLYSCVVNDGYSIYIIGGGNYTKRTLIYHPATLNSSDEWELANGQLLTGRSHFGCSFNRNRTYIYAFAGQIGGSLLESVKDNTYTWSIERYSIEYDEWELVTNVTSNTIFNVTSPYSHPITLSVQRYSHSAQLDPYNNNIYIFGGGGCSGDNVICLDYRNLVEVFNIDSHIVSIDTPILYQAISNSYCTLFFEYREYEYKEIINYNNTNKTKTEKIVSNWFNAVVVIGGQTENTNLSNILQYRIPPDEFYIKSMQKSQYQMEPVTYVMIIMFAVLILCLLLGYIHSLIKQYTDTRLIGVLIWFLYEIDFIFDCALNIRLWSLTKYQLALPSLIFIILPMLINIGWQLRIGIFKWTHDMSIRERVDEYLLWHCQICNNNSLNIRLFLFSILSGSSHGLINLINSNLFGLSVFNMGLISRHIVEYNITRLQSSIVFGNIPQLIIQLLYILEWGTEDAYVICAGLTSLISLIIGLFEQISYRHSSIPLRRLMLDEDFTKAHFLILRANDIYDNKYDLIHRGDLLIEAISQTIDVLPSMIEINLCQIVPAGIKICFIEYSGTKNTHDIIIELKKSIDEGWLTTAIKNTWKLNDKPVIEHHDEQQMRNHKQLLTEDLIINMRTMSGLFYDESYNNCSCNCNKRCFKNILNCKICKCSGCDTCRDLVKQSTMRRR